MLMKNTALINCASVHKMLNPAIENFHHIASARLSRCFLRPNKLFSLTPIDDITSLQTSLLHSWPYPCL